MLVVAWLLCVSAFMRHVWHPALFVLAVYLIVASSMVWAVAELKGQGVATVNPIFTWVRLAQRIPVPLTSMTCLTGSLSWMTATVQIDAPARSPTEKGRGLFSRFEVCK